MFLLHPGSLKLLGVWCLEAESKRISVVHSRTVLHSEPTLSSNRKQPAKLTLISAEERKQLGQTIKKHTGDSRVEWLSQMLRKGIEEHVRAKSVSLRSSPDIAALKIIEGHLCNFPLLNPFNGFGDGDSQSAWS